MPVSVTLAESAKLSQNQMVSGVIENVITTNQMYQLLGFAGIDGNALQYQRENVLGDVMTATVGTELTANNPATFTSVTSSLTTIAGKASVNGLIQATRSNFTDQAETQIASKAKSVGRKYQDMFINGDSGAVATDFDGLLNLSGQTVAATATDGDVLSFEKLDEGMSSVTSKDGAVDFITMNDRELRKYMSLLRALGGASINEVVTLPNGQQVMAYRGVPIFRNDYLPITQTQGASTAASSIIMGCFDDGSMTNGISGITAANDSGIHLKVVGQAENYDEEIYHVLWYAGLASFSDKGLVVVSGIVN
jgi:hypothetical protein